MISKLCKKIANYCCCFKSSALELDTKEDVYNVFVNDGLENNVLEKLPRTSTSTSFNKGYSLSNDAAFTYSDIYR